jgi:integrase
MTTARKRRGRDEGSIYQRADGQWVGVVSLGYDDRGKRKRRVVYGASKKEVQEGLRQLQIDHSLGRLTDASKFTVSDFLALWLETIARVKVAPSTYDRYKLVVDKQIKPHLGGVRLDKLAGGVVSMLDAKLERAGASYCPLTIPLIGSMLFMALPFCVTVPTYHPSQSWYLEASDNGPKAAELDS